jgi:hypothetical protein
MKLKYVDIRTSSSLNTVHIMSVAPIREIDDQLVIWRPFFNGLSQTVLDSLASIKYTVKDDFPLPYTYQTSFSEQFNRLLMLYYESFDYQHHHDETTMGLAKIIPVPNKCKEEMAEITNIRLQRDRPIERFFERDAIEYLLPIIRTAMISHPTWFVKLSTQSNKHDSIIKSVGTAEDVLDVITNSPTLLIVEWQRRKSTYIILKPWNPLITEYNEFRLFVWERKVTAATQQHCYTSLLLSQECIDTIINAIDNYNHSLKLPSNCVLDVIILEDATIRIIELNPWICSGSGLFEWASDYRMMFGLEGEAELRLATDNM